MPGTELACALALQRMIVRHWRRLVLFGLVGISGALVNMALLYLLAGVVGVNHLVAAAIASEISILNNFALNDRWTFSAARPTSSRLQRAVQYNSVALGGMVISLTVLAALTLGFGMHYMVANIFAMATATLSNYTLNSRITWAPPVASDLTPAPVLMRSDV